MATATYPLGWAPPGVDMNIPGCPTSLFISQRAVTAGESLGPGPRVDLGDGHSASGSVSEGTGGDLGGACESSAHFFWIAHGVAFTLDGWNVNAPDVLRIARSLNE